jgi:hypothetical protein
MSWFENTKSDDGPTDPFHFPPQQLAGGPAEKESVLHFERTLFQNSVARIMRVKRWAAHS